MGISLFHLQTADEDPSDDRRCREIKGKLSLLSQKLRILINVCPVYSTRLERALGRESSKSLGHIAEEEDDEESVLPTLSNEVSLETCLGTGVFCYTDTVFIDF